MAVVQEGVIGVDIHEVFNIVTVFPLSRSLLMLSFLFPAGLIISHNHHR